MHKKVMHEAITCKCTTILTKKFDKLDSGMVVETEGVTGCSGNKVRGLRFFDNGELISGLIDDEISFPASNRPAEVFNPIGSRGCRIEFKYVCKFGLIDAGFKTTLLLAGGVKTGVDIVKLGRHPVKLVLV
jgi:hypothetical protein